MPFARSNSSEMHRIVENPIMVSFWPKMKPYSLDLTTADFFLFLKMKTPMKGKRFARIEEIKEKTKRELMAVPKFAF